MKKQLLFLFFTIISFNFYAQDDFEKGYFIDNDGQQVECFIKKNTSKNNPTEFEYKLSENADVETANITSVKEFGVDDYLKYIRVTTKIDRSSENFEKMDNQRAPRFKEEELFLRVLVEGKANLYAYTDNSLRRYFYKKDDVELKQLIFKSFIVNNSKVSKNNRYRQQLLHELKCPSFTTDKIERVGYKKKDLVKFFTDYNECHESDYVTYVVEQQKDLFSLSIRPRINRTTTSISNQPSSFRDFNLGNKPGFGIGVEAEFILPFKKENNRWAVIIEPTFMRFKDEKIKTVDNYSTSQLEAEIDYNSLEIPVGLRRYFVINKKSKFFANFSYVLNLNMDSTIQITRDGGVRYKYFNALSAVGNFALGLGYKYNDKYSVEFRLYTNKELLNKYANWTSEYKTMSLIFGYTIF
ncbi:MAG: tRNA modification GTPase [Bacteroidota bacterium]